MASSKRPTLIADERSERGTRAIKRLRRDGLVPGVVYGGGNGDSTVFSVNALALRKVLVDGSALIDLGGKTLPVIVKDQQLHPVRDEVMHIDLLEVRLDEKIQTVVGVHSRGRRGSAGHQGGGVLEHVTHQLNIEALPTAIPDFVSVDDGRRSPGRSRSPRSRRPRA